MTKQNEKSSDRFKRYCSNVGWTVKGRLVRVQKPRYVWLEVTDMCNSKCEYCNIHSKKPTPNPLSPAELKKILSDDLFKDVGYVANSGGECTVRSDFRDILFAEHEALPKARLNISTNGLLPDKVLSIAKEACQAGIKLEVGISLDGIGESHDRIRGVPGNFQKVVHLLDGLSELPVDVNTGATLDGRHIKDNMEAKAFVEARGLHWIFHWFNVSPFYSNTTAEDRDLEGIKNALMSFKPDLYRQMWLDSLKGKKPKFKCFALNTFLVLKCNGDVVPCLSLWNDVIGNMRTSTPKSVWYGKKADEVRVKVRNCSGCLNSWGYGWSNQSDLITNGIPYIIYLLSHKRVV